ncbi:InlB B-repeat-containing protein, partial [Paenibacillus sepulcri]|nr:InlB B-repeat-containing protein [Paenibacillus sepulcri]
NGDGVSGLVSVLSFDLNGGGGAAPDDIRVFASSLAEAGITLPTPVRPGYTFSGWYTDASSGTRISGTDTIDADRILYAHWNEKPSVIIGMSDTALKSGETATLTFTFSERPTGFAANDITAPTGSLGPLSSIIDNGDGTFGYTILYTPNAGIEDDT